MEHRSIKPAVAKTIEVPTLLTKKQVADIFDCSVGTINNLMKINKIKYYKLGSMVRFRADELPIFNKVS